MIDANKKYIAIRNGDKSVYDLDIVKANKKTANVVVNGENIKLNLEKMEIKMLNDYLSYKVYPKDSNIAKQYIKMNRDRDYAKKVKSHLERVIREGKIGVLKEIGEKIGVEK